jgi:hypothetical protein
MGSARLVWSYHLFTNEEMCFNRLPADRRIRIVLRWLADHAHQFTVANTLNKGTMSDIKSYLTCDPSIGAPNPRVVDMFAVSEPYTAS